MATEYWRLARLYDPGRGSSLTSHDSDLSRSEAAVLVITFNIVSEPLLSKALQTWIIARIEWSDIDLVCLDFTRMAKQWMCCVYRSSVHNTILIWGEISGCDTGPGSTPDHGGLCKYCTWRLAWFKTTHFIVAPKCVTAQLSLLKSGSPGFWRWRKMCHYLPSQRGEEVGNNC